MPARRPATPAALPRGEVALEYALVADTLLAWTVAGGRVDLFRGVVDTVRLARTTERLLRRMEEGADAAELRPDLARLYGWLVRPVEGRLGAADAPLVLVADGDIASLPFAALYDARRGRYLMQDHPLRTAASLREAASPAPRAGAAGPAVFVADPAFRAGAHPGFERLPSAAGEVREIAAAYPPRARVLAGAAASGGALRAALGSAGMLHYAGHAVFEDERPERSYLLLAPTPGDASLETLQAGEIAQMDLRNLRLVVLAACRTVRTGRGRAAGFSGSGGRLPGRGRRWRAGQPVGGGRPPHPPADDRVPPGVPRVG